MLISTFRGTFPRVPGHEVIGTVVAVGEGVDKWKEGDRVGGPWHGGHDGICKSCNRGLFQMCDNGLVNGVNRDGGCETVCSAPVPPPLPKPNSGADNVLQMPNTVFSVARPL
jgi:D-arabinose 1-dehydrogenase-like Zn-dependent alcohol dehydrogenase